MICVCPRVKRPEPCVRGHHGHLDLDRPDLRLASGRRADACRPRSSGGRGSCRSPRRPSDVALGERVLDPGSPSLAGPRERQLDGLDDAVEEQVPLGRLELLRVLLGLGERRAGRSRTARAPASRRRPSRCFSRIWSSDIRVCSSRSTSSSVELIDERAHLLARRSPRRSRRPRGGRAPGCASRSRGRRPLEPLGRRRVEPLRLAGLRAQLLLRLAELHDLAMRDLERLEELLLGHLVRAGLDHRQAVLGADDDQVEVGAVLGLLERRVDDELAVDQAHAHGADRPEERQRRDGQRRRDGVDREDVVRR